MKEEYVNALLKEIDFYYQDEPLKTLYFGGGTPSLLTIEQLQKIKEKFNFAKDCEITLELNPDDAYYEYVKGLKEIGINRLSIGSQTFDDKILKIIGRRHNSNAIKETVKMAKEVGFENISLDLIYGLPTQNITVLNNDLKNILELDVQHISTYGLKIEENSYFGKNLPQNLPNDDEQADMYEYIDALLSKNGYIRYEVSNFSKVGNESKHNLNYWNNDEYYGFGVSAHGYVKGVRYSNSIDLDKYILEPVEHEFEHKQTKVEMLEEEIFLGFRKSEGIDIKKIMKNFGIDFDEKYSTIIQKYSPKYIEKTKKGYKLTQKGVLLSNIILSEFIEG